MSRIKTLYFILAFSALIGCGRSEKDLEKHNRDSTVADSAEQVSADSIQQEVLKPILPVYLSDPCSLMSEFLDRDYKGEFVHRNKWLDSVVIRPATVPRWEQMTLIKDYKIIPLKISDKSAVFNIRYKKIADVIKKRGNPYLYMSVKTEIKRYELVNTIDGWKIISPLEHPRISAESTKNMFPETSQEVLLEILHKVEDEYH